MKLHLTLAALGASVVAANAAIVAQTSFEIAEGFPTGTVSGGFNVVTGDGANWVADGTLGNFAGAWAGQTRTGGQAAVIGNNPTTGHNITVDAAGADGVGVVEFFYQRFTASTGNLLVQWTTDTLNGSESWTTATDGTIDITGGAGGAGVEIGGWTQASVAINQLGDVKVRLILDNGSGGASFDDITVNDFTAVPEPSSTALLGLGGLALILRRRK